jgi:hypothetical protein
MPIAKHFEVKRLIFNSKTTRGESVDVDHFRNRLNRTIPTWGINMAIREWTREHDTILTVVGAIIMVFSFVAKEVYLEDAKDVRASLEAIERDYIVEGELETIEAITEETRDKLDQAQPDPTDALSRAAKSKKGKAQEGLDSIEVHLESIDQLDHYLPPDAVRECKKDEIERLRTLRDELKSKPPDEVITELDALSKQIEDCERRLVRTAVRLEFDSKTNVRFWTHLDYLLFGIGSVLTLFGKLAKRENIDGVGK